MLSVASEFSRRQLRRLPITQAFAPPGVSVLKASFHLFGSLIFSLVVAECMALFGDAVAWHRMPKYTEDASTAAFHPRESPYALADIGFEIIPFFCPLPSPNNIQTYVLEFLMIFVVARSIFHKNGRFILQRSFHVMSCIYLLRWSTVALTYLPNPNPHCFKAETHEVSLVDAIKEVGNGFPPGSCGNLIFSGHTAQLCLYGAIGFKYELWGPWHGVLSCKTSKLYIIPVLLVLLGCVSVIGCRSHYSIDVVLAVIISLLTVEVCFLKFPLSSWVCWAELTPLQIMRFEDVEDLNGQDAMEEHEQTKVLPGRGSKENGGTAYELAVISTE